MQHKALAERPGLADRARHPDHVVVALPALGNADVLGRDVGDPAMQAEALVAILNGRTDVAEAGRGQKSGEKVAKEPLRALFDEMRRPDDAALGYVADRRAFVRGPRNVERAPREHGELEASSRLDVDRIDFLGQPRTQLAGAGAGDLGYLAYPAAQVLFADEASVKLRQGLPPCSLMRLASNGYAIAPFDTANRHRQRRRSSTLAVFASFVVALAFTPDQASDIEFRWTSSKRDATSRLPLIV